MSARAKTAALKPANPGLADPLTALAGVGPAKAALLGRAGLHTLRDLATLPPRGLIEPSAPLDLAAAARTRGTPVRVRGKLTALAWTRLGPRGASALRATLADGTTRLDALFVNQPWLKKRLVIGAELELEGRIGGTRAAVLVGPRIAPQALAPGTLAPAYGRIEGISNSVLAGLVRRALGLLEGLLPEELPRERLAALALLDYPAALAELAAPTSRERFEGARRRLALDGLLVLQARLVERLARRGRGVDTGALRVRHSAKVWQGLFAALPFEPTDGQRRIVDEISRDLARAAPMRRLLQGDVGAGKTAVALVAAAGVKRAGGQSAFLAPTELLAEQHLAAAEPLLLGTGLRADLLVGSQRAARKRDVLERLATGEIDLLFGTHALFSGGVRFAALALAIIDEQHRFGVAQRRRLLEKGAAAHALLMTATPIPRTLALTLYGDLEVSALREKPPGRSPIVTRVLAPHQRPDLVRWLAGRIAAQDRVFWVLPRIEANDDGPGAEDVFAAFAASSLAAHGVEIVHGRRESSARQAALARFRCGEARLLVGTTVLEVGVDVPEAAVMVVEGADRFGLAQLHQLRGRVGRGSRGSHCFLIAEPERHGRLEVLVRTEDGFAIAEEDLRQRGMGDLLGLRQSGANAEGLAGFEDDLALWTAAREIVSEDPGLRRRLLARAAPHTARD